jgi:hypothetical protein
MRGHPKHLRTFAGKFLNRQGFLIYNLPQEAPLMKSTRLLVWVVALVFAMPALANDQQKAQKELNKVTALARDLTGRTVVNLSMSQTLNVPRMTLVQQRVDTGLNYGSLFLASELIKSGAAMPDIAAQLKAGKKITDIANDRHADWKTIAEDTKKFNGTVDRNLYKYFLLEKRSLTPAAMKTSAPPAAAEEYDVHHDGVKADADDAGDKEIEDAQNRFLMLKDSAAKAKGDNKTLGLGDERIGYSDHTQGPGAVGTGAGGSANTNTGTTAPGFGGPQ